MAFPVAPAAQDTTPLIVRLLYMLTVIVCMLMYRHKTLSDLPQNLVCKGRSVLFKVGNC
jgi:hypothetical protein